MDTIHSSDKRALKVTVLTTMNQIPPSVMVNMAPVTDHLDSVLDNTDLVLEVNLNLDTNLVRVIRAVNAVTKDITADITAIKAVTMVTEEVLSNPADRSTSNIGMTLQDAVAIDSVHLKQLVSEQGDN